MNDKEYYREYRRKNKEKLQKYLKDYYIANRAKLLEQQRIYFQNNKEAIQQRRKGYPSYPNKKFPSYNDPVRRRQAYLRSKENSIPYYLRRRILKSKLGGEFTFQEWQNVLSKQSKKCLDCGSLENLSVDHIIPISKWVAWAKDNKPNYLCNDIENIQALCLRCNKIKSNKLPEQPTNLSRRR